MASHWNQCMYEVLRTDTEYKHVHLQYGAHADRHTSMRAPGRLSLRASNDKTHRRL